MRRSATLHHPGFTLVELLVVIGIITLLIAILLPVLARVRQQAYEVRGGANLRTIGQGLIMYVNEYKVYPAREGNGDQEEQHLRYIAIWPSRVRRVMGGGTAPFNCPARPPEWAWEKVFGPPGQRSNPPPVAYANEAEAGAFGYEVGERMVQWPASFSYGYNGRPLRGLGDRSKRYHMTSPRRATQVRRPSEMIAIADGTGTPKINPEVGDVHRGGANVLFCDGHVRWYAQKELMNPDLTTPPGQRISAMWNYHNRPSKD